MIHICMLVLFFHSTLIYACTYLYIYTYLCIYLFIPIYVYISYTVFKCIYLYIMYTYSILAKLLRIPSFYPKTVPVCRNSLLLLQGQDWRSPIVCENTFWESFRQGGRESTTTTTTPAHPCVLPCLLLIFLARPCCDPRFLFQTEFGE